MDAVDREIVALVARRVAYVRAAARFKTSSANYPREVQPKVKVSVDKIRIGAERRLKVTECLLVSAAVHQARTQVVVRFRIVRQHAEYRFEVRDCLGEATRLIHQIMAEIIFGQPVSRRYVNCMVEKCFTGLPVRCL